MVFKVIGSAGTDTWPESLTVTSNYGLDGGIGNYVLGVDVWEGQLDIDEAVLKAAGVGIILIRLNDINGGHHLDENFYNQWEQAASFVRVPYFVYNPWVSGGENYVFLVRNMPSCKLVCVDIEVKKAGLSPVDYYNEVRKFFDLSYYHDWKVIIYTGAWFLPMLSQWPTDYEYWWARYPYAFYPPEATHISWETLKLKLVSTNWSPGTTPGPCKLWQFSGDRLVLPGTIRPIDLNLWRGTLDELYVWAGQTPPPASQDWRHAIDQWARTKGYDGPPPEMG